MGSHEGHLVVSSSEEGPQRVHLPPDGAVPSSLLGGPAGGLARAGRVGLVLLLWHLHHGILGLVELGPLLCGTLFPPAHLRRGERVRNRETI